MTILSTDTEKTLNPFTRPVKRDTAPSGSNVLEDLFNFILDTPLELIPETQIDPLIQLMGDLQAIDKIEMNEARHFTHKSSSIARTIARKFYKANAPRIKAAQSKLKKSKAAKKKKEIMAKSDRTPIKKHKKKKYNTKKHTINERINRSIEKGVKETVAKWFAPTPYRVIKTFQITEDLDAVLNERVEHIANNTWRLTKRNGERFKFEVENNHIIKQCIKHEALIEIGDFL